MDYLVNVPLYLALAFAYRALDNAMRRLHHAACEAIDAGDFDVLHDEVIAFGDKSAHSVACPSPMRLRNAASVLMALHPLRSMPFHMHLRLTPTACSTGVIAQRTHVR